MNQETSTNDATLFQLEMLSPIALKLYLALQAHFKRKRIKYDWIKDEGLSRLARIPMGLYHEEAKSELSRSRLMHLTQVKHQSNMQTHMTPAMLSHRLILPSPQTSCCDGDTHAGYVSR